jgi:hypothetical protein
MVPASGKTDDDLRPFAPLFTLWKVVRKASAGPFKGLDTAIGHGAPGQLLTMTRAGLPPFTRPY